MADYVRRHRVYLSDREVKIVDRALSIYATLLRVLHVVGGKQESDEVARVARTTQAHFKCRCSVPEGVLP